MPPERIRLRTAWPAAWVEAQRAKLLDDRHYDPHLLIGGRDVDVYKPDGSPLLLFRAEVLPAELCVQAYPHLLVAGSQEALNRGDAAGGSYPLVRKDGTVTRVHISDPVRSGIMGA